MSESQDLEKAAKESYVNQRMQELGQYIESLFAELDLAHRRRAKHRAYFLAAWGTWMLAGMCHAVFGGWELDALNQAAMLVFWGVAWAEWMIIMPHHFGIIDQLEGCFRTLEILGMLEPRDRGRRRIKKYKESWMYKFWQALKSQKMQQAFA